MSTSIGLALAVSAGVAAGVFLNPASLWPARWLVAIFGLPAFLFAARGYAASARLLGASALAAVCALLGADAQHRAMYPPLRQLLEAQFGGFAIESIGLERHDTPFEIEGRLMADAAITAPARICVSRSTACGSTRARNRRPAAYRSRWRASSPATPCGEWRAGRLVRMPAVLRRPARYLNDGVADQELLLARRGIALVGSVKSAALVQVVQRGPWFAEWASAIRATVRGALARHVEHARSAVGRGGGGHPDRRSQLARSGRGATPAGGGNVPRHRHLRRQHRHSGRVDSCRAVGDSAFAAAGRPAPPWRCWRRMATSPARGPPCCVRP